MAWTGWHAPQEKDTYETYYDLVTDAMYPHGITPTISKESAVGAPSCRVG